MRHSCLACLLAYAGDLTGSSAFNSNSMFPISAKTLVRWANMIRPISLSPDSAEIWKEKTKPGSLTSYRCELTESAIDPNSVLVQGYYAYHDPSEFASYSLSFIVCSLNCSQHVHLKFVADPTL